VKQYLRTVCLLKLCDDKNTLGVKELTVVITSLHYCNLVALGTRLPPRMAILQELMEGKSCDPNNILLQN
jgi:hypothetical protein